MPGRKVWSCPTVLWSWFFDFKIKWIYIFFIKILFSRYLQFGLITCYTTILETQILCQTWKTNQLFLTSLIITFNFSPSEAIVDMLFIEKFSENLYKINKKTPAMESFSNSFLTNFAKFFRISFSQIISESEIGHW